jgi:hypothetical protein
VGFERLPMMHAANRGQDPELDNWRAAVREVCDRLDADYFDRVKPFADGFGTWASATMIGYEIPLAGRFGGRIMGRNARYARRTGPFGLFGRRVKVRGLADIELEFRKEIDEWLREREAR